MAHFAHYQVLTDNQVINLPNFSPAGGTGVTTESLDKQRIVWESIADGIVRDGGGRNRPILCFNVDLDNANGFQLRVWTLNSQGADKTIFNWTYSGNDTRQIMEPFPIEWVRDDQNSIMFERISGNGTGAVQIRNVIVLYLVNKNF